MMSLYPQYDLGDILTAEQVKAVNKIINNSSAREFSDRLKDYFTTIAGDLQEKGILPDYLACAITYALVQGVEREA